MNENARRLRSTIAAAGLSRLAAAKLLHVSINTVHAWLKPDGNKGANPCPGWAPELLDLKTEGLATLAALEEASWIADPDSAEIAGLRSRARRLIEAHRPEKEER